MGSLKVVLSSLLKLCTVKRINPSGLAVSSSITTSCGSLDEESPFAAVESPPVSNEEKRVCKNIWICTKLPYVHNSNVTEAFTRYKTVAKHHIPSFVSISSWSLSFSVAFILSSSLQFEILGRRFDERVPVTTLMCLLAMRPIATQNPEPGNTAMSPYCIESFRSNGEVEDRSTGRKYKVIENLPGQTFVLHCDI